MEYIIFQASQEWENSCLTEEIKAKLTKAGFTIRDVNHEEEGDWDEEGFYHTINEAHQTSYITLNSLEDLHLLYKTVGRCIFQLYSIMIYDSYIE